MVAVPVALAASSLANAQRPAPTRPPVTSAPASPPNRPTPAAASRPGTGSKTAKSPKAPKAPKAARWRLAPVADLTLLFDSNPFLLNNEQLARVDAPRRADSVSGRYRDMESASDLRLIGRIAVVANRKAPNGRTLRLQPWLELDRYSRNAERQQTAFGVEITQELRHQGSFSVAAAVTPSYFARNYLADAVDLNGNGRIAASERRYARGEYAERSIDIDYERRLRKASKADPLAAWLQLGLGYRDRPSAAPFDGRSLNGPTAALGLRFKHRNDVEADTRYEVQLLGSPVSQQIVLLDESAFNTDFNRNGSVADANVRSVQTVDRSRTSHSVRQRLRVPLSDVTALHAELGLRIRQFGSNEPFDVANNGRRDQRLRLGAHLTHRLSDALRLEVGARYDGQRLNRRTDLGAEGAVDDFTRTQAWLGMRLTP
jgi:hypothetical protein